MVGAAALAETPAMTKSKVQLRFGRRVKALRQGKKLSQEELAEAIGRSVDTVSNIERGFAATRISTADSIAKTLGVSLKDLFDFSEDEAANDGERRRLALFQKLMELFRKQDSSILEAAIRQSEALLSLGSNRARDRD